MRPRIAQILLLPEYRRHGIGARLLQAVYNDLVPDPTVIDITGTSTVTICCFGNTIKMGLFEAEDPSDNYVGLRDFVDCRNAAALSEFAPDKLKQGYGQEMRKAALEKLKIGPV